MEVMALPNKETLIFYKQIRPWIVSGEMKNDVMNYKFSDETPSSIFDLFDKIKEKLSYPSVRIL